MTTVLFIHGTGVRRDEFDDTYREVEKRLHAKRPGVDVRPCYWGDIGAALAGGGNSFYFDPPEKPKKPKKRRKQDGGQASQLVTEADLDKEHERALWLRLLDEPLFEIRLRRPEWKPRLKFSKPKGLPPADRVAALSSNPELAAELEGRGLTAAFAAATAELLASAAFTRAFGKSVAVNGKTLDMLARTLTARCLVTDDEGELDTERLNEFAALVRQALGAADYGSPADPFKALAAELAMRAADPWMWKLRRSTIRMLGDILLYQGRGDEIREFIRCEVVKLEGPVVLLAHSLGGIMAFDLLAGTDRTGLGDVTMLVTAGSQVPLFYELRALRCGLEYPSPLPDWFPASWLNFYDESDLLSYAGEDLFYPGCTDVRLDTGRPFPKAHGAYWRAREFYAQLDRALDAAEGPAT